MSTATPTNETTNTPQTEAKKIRLVVVTKSTGGLAHYNTEMCKRLDRDRFDIHVICLSDNNEAYAAELRELGVSASTMAMNRYAISVTSDWRLAQQLTQYIRDNNFDVMIGHGSKAGFLVRWVERRTGIKAIYALASMSFVPRIHGNKAHVYKQLERFGSMLGGHIVTVAYSTRDELIENKITTPDRATAIHTGIDLVKFGEPLDREEACKRLNLDPSRLVVGWAARLMPQKGPLDFVRACKRIVEAVPDVQIFMAGEGELADDVQKLIDEYKIGDNMIRAGWQTDVPAMLSAFDVYVLSSFWEGLPLSLLEAMAMKRASVATAVDGSREVIQHGIDGFLVEAGNDTEIAEHVVKLLQDDQLRYKMAQAARERVETAFHVDKMIKEWEDLIVDVAQGKK